MSNAHLCSNQLFDRLIYNVFRDLVSPRVGAIHLKEEEYTEIIVISINSHFFWE